MVPEDQEVLYVPWKRACCSRSDIGSGGEARQGHARKAGLMHRDPLMVCFGSGDGGGRDESVRLCLCTPRVLYV